MFNNLIGVPFVDGGRDPKTGLDCWGLVLEIYRRYGIALPDYKISCEEASQINGEIDGNRQFWERVGHGLIPVPALVVIKFNTTVFCNHTGVYLGQNKFIHTRERVGVNIDRIDSPAWRRQIEGFYIPKEGAKK